MLGDCLGATIVFLGLVEAVGEVTDAAKIGQHVGHAVSDKLGSCGNRSASSVQISQACRNDGSAAIGRSSDQSTRPMRL